MDFTSPFRYKKPISPAGFTCRRSLPRSGFVLAVTVSPAGDISTAVTDPATGEEYTLHLSPFAAGEFVGSVRADVTEALAEIAREYFRPAVYSASQTLDLIDFVSCRYGDELEFLWKSSPASSIWRRKDTGKWYGVLMTVSRRKLGIDSDETAEILDSHCPPEELEALVDGRLYFPGWHMNKKHWCTVVLDGSVSTEEICRRLDVSYRLAEK